MRALVFGILTAIAAAGCGSGRTHVQATVTSDPALVSVAPGVYALTNWGEPVFYSNNSYWLYDDGRWYRSRYYTGGWVRARPPYAVMRIERPSQYTYYRPDGRRIHTDVREERVRRDRHRRDRDRYRHDRDRYDDDRDRPRVIRDRS